MTAFVSLVTMVSLLWIIPAVIGMVRHSLQLDEKLRNK